MINHTFDYDSDEWQMEREEALTNSYNTCRRCGFSWEKGLHCHHTHGAGFSSSIEVLCAWCHAKHHNNWDILDYGAWLDTETGCVILNNQVVYDPAVVAQQKQKNRIAAELKDAKILHAQSEKKHSGTKSQSAGQYALSQYGVSYVLPSISFARNKVSDSKQRNLGDFR